MSQAVTPTEAGWRPDPSGRYEWRYWDGGWTNRVANSVATPDAPAPVATATPPPAPPTPATPPTPPAPAATVATPEPAPPAPTEVHDERPSRDSVARAPFGEETAPAAPAPPPVERRARRTPWRVVVDFVRSLADQPESYHNPLAREPLPDSGRGRRILTAAPGNYGHAGIIALAACGIVIGCYLPWLSGSIGLAGFDRSGFDHGLGAGYSIGAIALAISALLSVRMRVFRWLTVVLAFVIAGFVVRDLLNTYDAMQTMNERNDVVANVGTGLWIMIVSAAIAMIGSVRLSEDQKID